MPIQGIKDSIVRKKEKEQGFRPFSGLGGLVHDAGLKMKHTLEQPKEPLVEEVVPQPAPTDEELFRQAMDSVARTSWRHGVAPTAPPSPSPPPADPELADRRLMEAAVAGDPALKIEDHPEYIEGWVGLGAARYLPKLRSGLYSIQGQIDLHGMSREEARSAVEEFVSRMSRVRSCCIKVIHGRGINSPNDRAVIKENLHRWLSTRRMSHHVVAYASAPFADGGVGATYVLLRRSS
jgi:DNA-nicking Smr family endonuclease